MEITSLLAVAWMAGPACASRPLLDGKDTVDPACGRARL
jgi:hypothetical protein